MTGEEFAPEPRRKGGTIYKESEDSLPPRGGARIFESAEVPRQAKKGSFNQVYQKGNFLRGRKDAEGSFSGGNSRKNKRLFMRRTGFFFLSPELFSILKGTAQKKKRCRAGQENVARRRRSILELRSCFSSGKVPLRKGKGEGSPEKKDHQEKKRLMEYKKRLLGRRKKMGFIGREGEKYASKKRRRNAGEERKGLSRRKLAKRLWSFRTKEEED